MSAKPPAKKRGRPSHDWEALYAEFRKSDLSREDFLASKGISAMSGSTWAKTKLWTRTLRGELVDRLVASAGRLPVVDTVPMETIPAAAMEPYDPNSPLRTSWTRVLNWRAAQATQDWRMADDVLWHVTRLLNAAKIQPTAENKEWASALKPAELRQLARTITDVQRIQRLALGLSTDNIGIDSPADPAIAAAASADGTKPANLFVVEMTRGGKFVRARPRRAS